MHSWPRNNQQGKFARSIRHQGATDYYRPDKFVGKRTAQVRRHLNPTSAGFKDDDRDSYEKWSQALASAEDLVTHAAKVGANDVYSFIVPALVVSDNALWAVDYNEDGHKAGDPHPVDSVELFVDRDYSIEVPNYAETDIYHVSHLHIYTRVGFLKFLREITTSDRTIEFIFGFARS